jgi:hypothetical protein
MYEKWKDYIVGWHVCPKPVRLTDNNMEVVEDYFECIASSMAIIYRWAQ